MKKLSNMVDERTRKIESIILQPLAEKKQTTIAIEMGMSESKTSRLKNDDPSVTAKLIVCLGLNVVPDYSLDVLQAELKSIKTLARKYLEINETV